MEIDNIISKAEGFREKSDYQKSLALFRQAVRLCGAENTEAAYHCLLASGDLYRMTGKFDLAVENYLKAIENARGLKSPTGVADAKVGMGLALRAQGKWKEALKLIGESGKIYERDDDVQGRAFTTWAAAGSLRIKGDIPGAIQKFKEARMIFKSMKDIHGVGYCLCGIGGASRMAGRFKDSLKYYMAANKLFTSERDRFGRAYSFCGIGNAYRMLGDYKNALVYFAKATKLYTQMGDRVSFAYTLWGIGTACKMTGALTEAREYFTEALRLFKKTKDPRGIAYCDLGFGEIALLTGRKTAAEKFLSAALKTCTEYRFALEKCHAETLISFVNGAEDRRGKATAGKTNTCYDLLGLKLRFRALPLNIP